MIALQEIKDELYRKIRYVTSFDFPTQEEHNTQLIQIKANLEHAINQAKESLNISSFDWLIENYYKIRNESEKINEVIRNYYTNTNSFAEKVFSKSPYNDDFPFNLCWYFVKDSESDRYKRGKWGSYWDIINKAMKYFAYEDFEAFENFYVNIYYEGVLRKQNTLDVGKEFMFIIYFFSQRRLIRFAFDDNTYYGSIEHNIQLDLNRIDIRNESSVFLHYKGYDGSDEILLEDYKSAVQLRTRLSELRAKS